MKKLSILVLVALLVSMVTYGQAQWIPGQDTEGPKLSTSPDNTRVVWDGGGGELRGSYNTIHWERENFRIAIDADNNQGNAKFILSNNGFSDDKVRLHLDGGDSYINTGGNLGIGTTSPDEKLVVNGNFKINGNNRKIIAGGSGAFIVEGNRSSFNFGATLKLNEASNAYLYGGDGGGVQHDVILAHTGSQAWGNVGIGTTNPTKKLHIYQNTNDDVVSLVENAYSGRGAHYILQPNSNYAALVIQKSGTGVEWTAGEFGSSNFSIRDNSSHIFQIEPGGVANTLYLKNNGNVGIGITEPQSELAVSGTITAKEVIVTQDGWPDFVFADHYKLMSLDKLEKHIKANKSLPGIPTEKEVLESGVKVGDMQAKLLEKVEELTLYAIKQDKKISELEGKIARLEAEK